MDKEACGTKRKLTPEEALDRHEAEKQLYDFINPYLTNQSLVPTFSDIDKMARLAFSPHLAPLSPGSGSEPSYSDEEEPVEEGEERVSKAACMCGQSKEYHPSQCEFEAEPLPSTEGMGEDEEPSRVGIN